MFSLIKCTSFDDYFLKIGIGRGSACQIISSSEVNWIILLCIVYVTNRPVIMQYRIVQDSLYQEGHSLLFLAHNSEAGWAYTIVQCLAIWLSVCPHLFKIFHEVAGKYFTFKFCHNDLFCPLRQQFSPIPKY